MAILVVDDSLDSRRLIQRFLEEEGHRNFLMAGSAPEALQHLGADGTEPAASVDLIIMDLQLPGMNGIEACRRINADPRFRDIPIIVVTASSEVGNLPAAFQAGAVDYLHKPINPLELAARVRSVLRLKLEMDRRKEREAELLEVTYKLSHANRELQRLSTLDGLTGLTNRRRFDELLLQEVKRSARDGAPLSLVLVDIDHFKPYNDRYGHQAGDDCLKRVALTLRDAVQRPGDCMARYGGEEFVAILADTASAGARAVAETMRQSVDALTLEHGASATAPHVTVSLGTASVYPEAAFTPALLIAAADEALYEAKRLGRNQVRYRSLEPARDLKRSGGC